VIMKALILNNGLITIIFLQTNFVNFFKEGKNGFVDLLKNSPYNYGILPYTCLNGDKRNMNN
jgi:hypothetical protein